ncbi:MAG: folylpolyglutamate synthase/dihydrofolate synthase family protein [Syntrophales bacterium]|nr:folylpolyglutamate synthase/dihydrofolate synthase family protein [Syntrophales bacterium]
MASRGNLEYLSGLSSTVIRLGLGPISRLLERLNNPQRKYETVLIAGTNGKGSIAAMTASILCQGGFRVGLYTSPHLIDVIERIRINGLMITPTEMDERIGEVKKQVLEDVTYFEFLTAVAFLHFYREDVDVAVLEVGMGGRLDATNMVTPAVSVVSNISLDHREYLGNRLKDIAREKAGIIKDGGLCISAAKQKSVIKVLEEICRERRAKLYLLGRDIKVRMHRDGTFSYRGIAKTYHNLVCPLRGRHQMENAVLAIGTIETMAARGFHVDESALSKGMKDTMWEGRLEILQYAPMLLVDGAHNPAGVSVLCRALKESFSYKKLILLFGVLNDKDYRAMLNKLVSLADRLIITKPTIDRAVPPKELVPVAKWYKNPIEVVEKPSEALQRALITADKEDLICVTGSLYLVGEIKQAFTGILR